MSEREREIQATDVGNRTIAALLEQFHYLGAEAVLSAKKTADICRSFVLDI